MSEIKQTLWAASIVNKNGEPLIDLRVDQKTIAQMSPDQARSYALSVIVAAEAAEQDAFMYDFTKNRIGAGEAASYGIIKDFREWREKKKTVDGHSRK